MTEATGAQQGAGEGAAASVEKIEPTLIEGGEATAQSEGQQQAAQGEAGKDGQQQEQQQEGRQRGPDGRFLPRDIDWRDALAAEDKQFRKQLDRYADLPSVGKKLRSLEQKLSSGEYQRKLHDGATPEEIKAWRKEQGLPESEKGYVEALKLPNGVVPGETDQPLLESFAKVAAERNWSPQTYNDAVAWYYSNLDAQRAAQEEADAKYRAEAEDALRTAWQGPDYRTNLTAANNLLSQWPEDVRVAFLAARDPNGRKLGDNPGLLRQLAQLARELNPASSLIPVTSDPGKSVEGELAEIRKFARENPDKYDADKAIQARQIQLLEAQSKITARTRAA